MASIDIAVTPVVGARPVGAAAAAKVAVRDVCREYLAGGDLSVAVEAATALARSGPTGACEGAVVWALRVCACPRVLRTDVGGCAELLCIFAVHA